MALYNPYNSDDRYYSPYENTQQGPSPGLGAMLFNTAKTMAVFGLLNAGGKALAGTLSRGAATAIRQYGKGSLGNIARETGARSLGEIFGATSVGKDLNAIGTKLTSSFRPSLQAKDAYVSNIRNTQGASAAKIAGFKSSFKDFRTFAGSVGRMWKNTVWQGAGVAYAIDSFAGVNKDLGLEQKAFYDVPGQVGNFGKWLAVNSVFSMGFGAAGKMAGLAGAKTIQSARNAFSGPMGRAMGDMLSAVSPGMPLGSYDSTIFKKPVLKDVRSSTQAKFVTSVISNAMAFGRTVPEAMKSMNEIVRQTGQTLKSAWNESPTNFPRTAIKKLSASSPIAAAKRQLADIWRTQRANRRQEASPIKHAGLNILQFADELGKSSVANHATIRASGQSLSPLTDQFASLGKAQDEKRTLADEIFPHMDRVRNKDIVDEDWVQRTLGNLKKSYTEEESTRFMNTVLNMRSGIHMYKPKGSNIRGGGVDLGFLDPLYMARKVTNGILSKGFKVPFSNVTLKMSDLLQTHTLLGQSPSFDFFKGPQDFAIGKNARGLNFSLENGKVVSTADLDQQAYFTAYINGNFATVGPGAINVLDTGNRLIATAHSSSFREAEKHRIQLARNPGVYASDEPSALKGNKFLGYFIDNAKLDLPGSIRRLWYRAMEAIKGKNHSYDGTEVTAFSSQPNDWYRSRNQILSIQETLGQDLSEVMKHPEFLKILGKTSGASSRGDTVDMAVSNMDVRDRLNSFMLNLGEGDNAIQRLNNLGITGEVAMIQANPSYASQHLVTKPSGGRPGMTAYDKVRVALIEDSVVHSWYAGGNMNHPLSDVIAELQKRGDINEATAKKLEFWGQLSALKSRGMYNSNIPSREVEDLGQAVLKHAREKNWNLETKLIDFVANNELKPVKAQTVQQTARERLTFFKNNTAYASVGKSPLGFMHTYTSNIFENVTNMLADTVFPFKKDPYQKFSIKGNMGYLFGGIGKVAGTLYAWNVLDTVTAANPLFDNTSFEDGLNGFLADNVARVRLGQSQVFDALGLTGVAKHLNGLMPGFVTSAPGAIAGAVVSKALDGGPLGMVKGFALGAIGNRLLSPYLPNFTKSYDQLDAEYHGEVEVPMMKSPTWLLGTTPYEGSKVIGYQPNWYVRTKSRWKETDTLYGSALRRLMHEPIPFLGVAPGDFIDPYYMERKHFFSRPYPETGEFGKEIPLIGPLIAGTIGRLIKPKKTMHQEFLTGPNDLTEDSTYPFSIQPPTVQEGKGMMYHTMGLRRMGGRSSLMGNYIYGGDSKFYGEKMGEEFLNNMQNFAGFPGFVADSLKEKLVTSPRVLPTLETAGRMASMSRSYYDMNLGGMGVFTEPVRRVIQKPEYKKYGINPIPNMMPNWLPQEFLTGDPYEKILKGELRLPGKAYQATHQIRKSMPARASMFGAPEDHMVQYFTGLLPPVLKEEYDILETGTTVHEKIQDHLAAEGLLIQAEAMVFDVKNDISGHVDAIIKDGRGGGGKRALEIKSINAAGFDKLDAPKYQHVGQLNFYLKQLKMREGMLLYVNRENPAQVKTFNITYSENRWQKDLRKLIKVRQVTADMMGKGYDDRFGYSYSWTDRLNILADVAPASKEYKEAKMLVQKQMKLGILNDQEITKYKNALTHRQARIRKFELYPDRFRGKVLSPDTQKNIQSINEDIKAAAEYTLPERIVGSIWESFANSNNFISNKFFAFKDPLEHYKMLQLYSQEYKPWDDPYGSFAETTMRGMAAETNPIGGAFRWAMPSYIVGGGAAAAVVGGILGMGYGTAHGLYRAATDSAYIPDVVQERRDIEGYFDEAKYERNKRMVDLSTGLTQQEYLKAMNATLTSFNQNGQDIANLFRSTPTMEKPYIEAWLNVRNRKEQHELLKYIPKELGKALKRQWEKQASKDKTTAYNANSSLDIAAGSPRLAFSRSVLDPSVNLEDIKLKTVEDAGLNAHDFGLGWNEQMYRLIDDYNRIQGANVYEKIPYDASSVSPGQVRQAIMEILRSQGIQGSAQVYVNNGSNDLNSVNITIRRDRSLTILRALEHRTQYYGD